VLDVYRMYLHLRICESTRWNILVECDTPGRERMRIYFRKQSLADSPKVFSRVSAGNPTVSMRIVATIVCTSSS
jgi:hypothetical protein